MKKAKQVRRHTENRMIRAHIRFAQRNGAELYNLGAGMDRFGIFSKTSLGGIESNWNPKRKQYDHRFLD